MASDAPFTFPSDPERSLKDALVPDFFYGYATAAPQVEGAADVDGKGPSNWDAFAAAIPSRVKDHSTPQDAVRSYEFYKQDVQLMKSYGANAYRFSLSWSRIIPLGGHEDPINPVGIAYYSNLIDELRANDIEPFVTLFHWDVPQALDERYGGPLHKENFIRDFVRYASVCFSAFGSRVKHWITFNEPIVFSLAGYAAGVHAPFRSSDRFKNPEGDSSTEPFTVCHHELLAHAHTVDLYRRQFQPAQAGKIGITLHGNYSSPYDATSPADIAAADRALEFEIAWFADPIYGGPSVPVDYPSSMRAQLGTRLPTFTPAEQALVRGSSDFYGMNTYTTFFVSALSTDPDINDHSGNIAKHDVNSVGLSRGPESDTYWLRTCPWGFRELLRWIWNRYHVPIYMTENGTTAKGEHLNYKLAAGAAPPEELLNDTFRIEFFRGYLTELAAAVKEDEVDIRSYFAWTFTDNWEWAAGFTDRFGATWVDFESEDKTRFPKRSAYFLRDYFKHLIREK